MRSRVACCVASFCAIDLERLAKCCCTASHSCFTVSTSCSEIALCALGWCSDPQSGHASPSTNLSRNKPIFCEFSSRVRSYIRSAVLHSICASESCFCKSVRAATDTATCCSPSAISASEASF